MRKVMLSYTKHSARQCKTTGSNGKLRGKEGRKRVEKQMVEGEGEKKRVKGRKGEKRES